MQWSSMCFSVFDYGNLVGLCVECMKTDENLQFSIQKLCLKLVTIPVKNRVSSAGMSIMLCVGQRRHCRPIPRGARDFLFSKSFRTHLGPNGHQGLFPTYQKTLRRADHSAPYTAEVRNVLSHTTTSGRGAYMLASSSRCYASLQVPRK
jgi:hypothetical protein